MTAQFGDLYHYGGTDYEIIKREPRHQFDSGKYGLKPDRNCCSACWDGFWCDFTIIDNRLLLKNLHIETEDGHYPVIAGVSIDLQQNRP